MFYLFSARVKMTAQACVVHWDIENQDIPSGCTAASVANRILTAVRQRYSVIVDSFVYCDASKKLGRHRTDLTALGFDVIDCSHSVGKPGQVDLRIIARALKPSTLGGDRPTVIIISGDGDFAYCVSTLRNAGVNTEVLYNCDRTDTVNTLLIQAASHANGVSFSGCAADVDMAKVNSEPYYDDNALDATKAAFIDAIKRSPIMAEDWRLASEVGSIFKKLRPNELKTAFKTTRQSLTVAGKIESAMDNQRDQIRIK